MSGLSSLLRCTPSHILHKPIKVYAGAAKLDCIPVVTVGSDVMSCLPYLWLSPGAVVALQWPNPRILCYKTSYSDMPSNSLRSCCSLYSLNLGFTVFWLLVFAIMVIARDMVRIIICLCFWIVHVAVVVIFR